MVAGNGGETGLNADQNLDRLIDEGKRVLASRHPPPQGVIGRDRIHLELFSEWCGSSLALIDRVFGAHSSYSTDFSLQASAPHVEAVSQGLGILRAARREAKGASRNHPSPPVGDAETGAELHPWGTVSVPLFDLDSDSIVDIISLSGLTIDWSLTPQEAYSHSTRKRAYRPRVDAAIRSLSVQDQLRATSVVAAELISRDESVAERLRECLSQIGWDFIEGRLVASSEEAAERFLPSGKPHDAYVEIRRIIQSAQQSVAVIDPYLDGSILSLVASSEASSLKVRKLSWKLPVDFREELERFRKQHPKIEVEVKRSREFHDRFLILDGSVCYHIGATLKDAGTRAFMINPVEDAENVRALTREHERAWSEANPVEPAA